jgi:hypothetical protein
MCVGCLKGKMTRSPMTGVIDHHTQAPLDLFVSDTIGPMRVATIGGCLYVHHLIDVHSRAGWITLMKKKSEATPFLIRIITQQQTQTGKKLKQFGSGGDGEILTTEFTKFLEDNGTIHLVTTPDTPQHNSIVERAGRSMIEKGKASMHHAGAPLTLWGEAFSCASYLMRRSLNSSDTTQTPQQKLTGNKPDVSRLHVWGCDVFYHIRRHQYESGMPGKLGENAKEGIFVGYDNYNDTYFRILDIDQVKIIRTRDVRFFDNSFKMMKKFKDLNPNNELSDVQSNNNNNNFTFNENDALPDALLTPEALQRLFPATVQPAHHQQLHPVADHDKHNPPSNSLNISNNSPLSTTTNINTINEQDSAILSLRGRASIDQNNVINNNNNINNNINNNGNSSSHRRSDRKRKQIFTLELNDFSFASASSSSSPSSSIYSVPTPKTVQRQRLAVTTSIEPETFEEAMASPDARYWLAAILDELQSHKQNETWTVVKRNFNMNVIGSKWVFKLKRNEKGEVVRFKARLVAKGFGQEYGVDYKETFAPVMRYKSLRVILSLSTSSSRIILQLDFKTAFLNATVKEDIYVSIPEGMDIDDSGSFVLKLLKALYGIKQAPHEWNDNINTFFIQQLRFTRCSKDTCIYIKISKTGNIMIIGLFVDDIVVSIDIIDMNEWLEIKRALQNKYDISDLGECRHILNMAVTRTHNTITLDQQSYIIAKLEQFRMDKCTPVTSPGDCNITAVAHESESAAADVSLYRAIVGSFHYLAGQTRPDIAHAVNMISRFQNAPLTKHMTAAHRILRYLRGNINYGLTYTNSNNYNACKDSVIITAFCDSDWGGDKIDHKSTTGFITYINNNIIQWNTHKQQTVALSSAEAELMAIIDVVKEVLWLQDLLTEMHIAYKTPTTIYSDNQSAIKMTQHDTLHDRSKHISIKRSFVKEAIATQRISIEWVSSQQQRADTLTKALTPAPFLQQRQHLVQQITSTTTRQQQ